MDREELRLPPQHDQEAVVEDTASWASTGTGCWNDKPFPNGDTTWVLYGYSTSFGAGFQVDGNDQISITQGHPQSDGGFLVTFTNSGSSTTGTIWVMYE